MVVAKEKMNMIEKETLRGQDKKDFLSFLSAEGTNLSKDQVLAITRSLLIAKRWELITWLILFLEFKNIKALPKDYHAVDITRNIILYYDTPDAEKICAKMLQENVNPFAIYQFPILTKYKDLQEMKELELQSELYFSNN